MLYVRSAAETCRNAYIDFEQRQAFTKESYERFVAIIATLCCLAHGFFTTQAEVLMMNTSYVQILVPYDDVARVGGFLKQFVVLFYVGELLGALGSFILSDELGRRNTMFYAATLCILFNFLSIFTVSLSSLLTLRFFTGLSLGMSLAVVPIYICETSTASTRGKCVGFMALSVLVGSLLVLVIQCLLQSLANGWRIAQIVPILALGVQAIFLCLLPQSPRWVLAQKTPADCLAAMRQLRRRQEVTKEFNDVYRVLASDAKLGNDWSDIFSSRSLYLRLVLACCVQLILQLMGMRLIATMAVEFAEETFVHASEHNSIIVGSVLVTASGLLGTAYYLKHVDTPVQLGGSGRRWLLLSGSMLMALIWVCAAICVYVTHSDFVDEHLSATNLFAHILTDSRRNSITVSSSSGSSSSSSSSSSYGHNSQTHWDAELTAIIKAISRTVFALLLCGSAFVYNATYSPISWTLAAEVFPYRVRAKASSLTTAFHFLGCLLSALTVFALRRSAVPATFDEAGAQTQLLGNLAVFSLILALFVYLFIPETTGYRLEHMEALFKLDENSACCYCCPTVHLSRAPANLSNSTNSVLGSGTGGVVALGATSAMAGISTSGSSPSIHTTTGNTTGSSQSVGPSTAPVSHTTYGAPAGFSSSSSSSYGTSSSSSSAISSQQLNCCCSCCQCCQMFQVQGILGLRVIPEHLLLSGAHSRRNMQKLLPPSQQQQQQQQQQQHYGTQHSVSIDPYYEYYGSTGHSTSLAVDSGGGGGDGSRVSKHVYGIALNSRSHSAGAEAIAASIAGVRVGGEIGAGAGGEDGAETGGGEEGEEDEGDEEEVELSTLHKYSAGMREHQFNYINAEEDEPLLAPNYDWKL